MKIEKQPTFNVPHSIETDCYEGNSHAFRVRITHDSVVFLPHEGHKQAYLVRVTDPVMKVERHSGWILCDDRVPVEVVLQQFLEGVIESVDGLPSDARIIESW